MLNMKVEGDFPIKLSRMAATTEMATTNLAVDMATWVKTDLKQRVPSQTGKLRNSIRYEINDSGLDKEVTFFAEDYAKFVDEGTGVYGPRHKYIYTKRVMKFDQSGQTWFHRKLDGQKAQKFTSKTFQSSLREANSQLQNAGEWIMRAVT